MFAYTGIPTPIELPETRIKSVIILIYEVRRGCSMWKGYTISSNGFIYQIEIKVEELDDYFN